MTASMKNVSPQWRAEECERQAGPCLTEAQWEHQLISSGFSGIDASVQVVPGEDNVASLILSTGCSGQPPVYPKVAVLTCDNKEQGILEGISKQLATITDQPKIATGHLTQVDLADQYGIFLAIDAPFWSDLTEDDLSKMQELVASSRGLLWVTRGAQSASPGMNMVTSFARTIRMENAGFRFATLDLDGQQVCSEAQTNDTIIKAFKHAFELDDCARFFEDLEFVESDGMLQISRALLD
ncbi:MAG: hypothetical protein Q9168_007794 [Polycauliona sp. 1 TL-2023]